MLVLSRRRGQRVLIAGDVEVAVLEIHGQQVRLGFTAPRDVAIVRTELLTDEKQNGKLRNRRNAAMTSLIFHFDS